MKIAFKGDYNRGIEIINLLKLLGGISPSGLIECLPKYRLRDYKLCDIEDFPLIFNATTHLKKWVGKINITINDNQ